MRKAKEIKPEKGHELERFRGHYNTFMAVQVINHLDFSDRQLIMDVIRRDFDPHYFTDLNCGGCIAKMLVYAFTLKDNQK